MRINRDKINVQLARRAFSIKDLAEQYGVSRARMNVILNSQNVTPACAGRLARALGVDVAEILENEE